MKLLPRLLVVLGVCAGALGASGFHTPRSDTSLSREPFSLALFFLGSVALGAGGILGRRSRAAAATAGRTGRDEKQSYADGIAAIRNVVVELEEGKDRLGSEEVRKRIAALMAEEYFDLTARSDALIRLVGFSDYARVWEGVALAERLLNRCWSMITDGHADEGLAELPHACKGIEQAARAMEELSSR